MSADLAPRPALPRAIWMLGFVSLLMDVSSEMIHSLLPLYMVTVLGASALSVGLIEGAAEATALIVKVFSGALSDWLGRRKGLALLGYGLGAASKPLFALASLPGWGLGWVLGARLIDRVGKGVRGAPRDALVADIAPPALRGAAFGLRQSLDTVGAFAGPLLAVVLMLLWHNDFRAVFWVAVLPALASVLLLWWGVQEPAPAAASVASISSAASVSSAASGTSAASAAQPIQAVGQRSNPLSRAAMRRMPPALWGVVALGGLFTLARFSEAFLVLRAQQAGIPLALVPLVMVAMNLVYAASAYPFGKLADRLPHRQLLLAGLLVLIAADVLLASSLRWPALLGGVALWGVHMGMTQGLLATMVADAAPADLRGTAFGVFNLVSGLALLLASVVAGLLWDQLGAAWTFGAGAGFCALTVLVLLHYPGPPGPPGPRPAVGA